MPRLNKRVERLEGRNAGFLPRPVIWLDDGETTGEGLARHVERHGPQEGAPLYIQLVGATFDR